MADTPNTPGVLRWLVSLLGRHAKRASLALGLGFATVGSAIGLMALSAFLIQKASLTPPLSELALAVVGVRFFGIARAVSRYAERYVGHDVTLRILHDLRVDVISGLEPAVPTALGPSRAEVVSRLVDDVTVVEKFFLDIVSPAVVAAATAAIATLVIAMFVPWAAVAFLATTLLAGVAVPLWSSGIARDAGRAASPARARLNEGIVELVEGAHDLGPAGRLDDRISEIEGCDRELASIDRERSRGRSAAAAAGALLSGLAFWAVLTLASGAAATGAVNALFIGVVTMTAMAAFEAIGPLGDAFGDWHATLDSARRVLDAIRTKPCVEEPTVSAALTMTALTMDGPAHIQLDNVSVTYPGEEAPALDAICAEFVPGQVVGIMGPSGSGKTTLAHLLVRFVDPTAGHVKLDGIDIRRFDSSDVRKRIGMAAQDAHIFDTTIRGNLKIAHPNVADDVLHRALDDVGLTDWVRSLPDGVETPVGENGARISRGQRRRLILARMLLADFDVLIFDEPTESIDPASTGELVARLLEASRGKTVVLITHDPALRYLMDSVIELSTRHAVASTGA